MEPLIIKSEKIYVPHVTFDKVKPAFEISGESYPEDPVKFYKPVMDWFDAYLEDPNDETNLEINLDYMNTTSTKLITELVFKLNILIEKGKKAKVTWYYRDNDEDDMHQGDDIEYVTGVPFEYVAFQEK
jgi:hypothetical protein